MNSPKNLQQIIGANSLLQKCLRHSQSMRELKRAICLALPKEYAKHCLFVHLKGNSLLLYVDSSIWSSRYRYLGPSILEELSRYDKYQKINDITLRTLNTSLGEYSSKFRRGIGEYSLEIVKVLQQTAVNKPLPLQNSLLRLANTLRTKKNK